MLQEQPLIERFRDARSDRTLAVLEGFHAVKHAIRFGADVLEIATADLLSLDRLASELAADARESFAAAEELPAHVFERLAPNPPPTGVIALARRPVVNARALLDDESPAPIVLLEDPKHAGNLGAAVRAAAALGAAGLLTLGEADPWSPAALRGSAGLHFALGVAEVSPLPASHRPLIALTPEGAPLTTSELPEGSLIAFGSERRGLSIELQRRADLRLAIPMLEGVSSLNLAVSVGVALFALKEKTGARGTHRSAG